MTAEEEVTGGQLKIVLKIDNIEFINTELQLCDIASEAGLTCPIKEGVHTLEVKQEIPDEAPRVRRIIIVLLAP